MGRRRNCRRARGFAPSLRSRRAWHPEASEDTRLFDALVAEAQTYREGGADEHCRQPHNRETLQNQSAESKRTPRSRARRFPAWRPSPTDRAGLLHQLATLVEEHHEEVVAHRVAERRQTDGGARGEVGMVAQVFIFYAGAVDKHHGRRFRRRRRRPDVHEPLGVVGLITPELPAQHRLVEARACARVRQHGRAEAELTPLSTMRLGSSRSRPATFRGRRNIVVGGAPRRQRLIRIPTRRRSVTGSARWGRVTRRGGTIARDARARGKSANVIFADGSREGRGRRAVRRSTTPPDCCAPAAHRAVGVRPVRGAVCRGDTQAASATRRTSRPRWGRSSLRSTGRQSRPSSRASHSSAAMRRTARLLVPGDDVEATTDDRVARDEVFGPSRR